MHNHTYIWIYSKYLISIYGNGWRCIWRWIKTRIGVLQQALLDCRYGCVLATSCHYAWWRNQMGTFPRYLLFVRGIHRWPIDSHHKGEWCGAWMFSLICAWTNSRANNREAVDLSRHRAHYDVTVMVTTIWSSVVVGYWAVAVTASWDVLMGMCMFTRMYYIHVYIWNACGLLCIWKSLRMNTSLILITWVYVFCCCSCSCQKWRNKDLQSVKNVYWPLIYRADQAHLRTIR